MRGRIAVSLIAVAALSHGAAAAQESDVWGWKSELIRGPFDDVRPAPGAMGERLRGLEAPPQTAAAPPAVAQAPTGPPPGPADVLRPRAPFTLAGGRGPVPLLFDIGIAGDFIGNLTQDNIDKANAGSLAGRENRVFPREIELVLFGQIDPYARGEVRVEAAEEFENDARVTEVGLAEANLTLLTLPFGTQAKLGQMRNRFGLLNERHREALPQPDVPNVLLRFFGEEGLVERGAELTWIPPLPVYVQGLVGLFNGDNEDAFGRGSLKTPLATGRVRTFVELGDLGAVQLGASAASGQTAERRRQTFAGYDVKHKLTPEGWRHPLLTLATEGIWSFRRVEVEDRHPTRQRFGWYAYGEAQPWRRWAAGLRYDSTQLLEAPAREWAIEPYLAFMPSDFLRFRLGYKHTERDRREPFSANDATARFADEVFLQATFVLGAHPPHPF
jgi:hypothetical protein